MGWWVDVCVLGCVGVDGCMFPYVYLGVSTFLHAYTTLKFIVYQPGLADQFLLIDHRHINKCSAMGTGLDVYMYAVCK